MKFLVITNVLIWVDCQRFGVCKRKMFHNKRKLIDIFPQRGDLLTNNYILHQMLYIMFNIGFVQTLSFIHLNRCFITIIYFAKICFRNCKLVYTQSMKFVFGKKIHWYIPNWMIIFIHRYFNDEEEGNWPTGSICFNVFFLQFDHQYMWIQ